MRACVTLLLAAALLVGCGPIINFGDGVPETVYTLHYDRFVTDDPDGALLLVTEPSFAEGLGGRLVTVRLSDFERTSLKNFRWTAPAGDLMRDYMIAALRDKAGARTVGEGGLDLNAACRLDMFVQSMAFVPGPTASQDRIEFQVELLLVSQVTGELVDRAGYDVGRDTNGTSQAIVAAFNKGLLSLTEAASLMVRKHTASCSPAT